MSWVISDFLSQSMLRSLLDRLLEHNNWYMHARPGICHIITKRRKKNGSVKERNTILMTRSENLTGNTGTMSGHGPRIM